MNRFLLLLLLAFASSARAQQQPALLQTNKALINDLSSESDITERINAAKKTNGRHIIAARGGVSLVAIVEAQRVTKYEAYTELGEKLVVDQEKKGNKVSLCVREKRKDKTCWSALEQD